MSDNSNNNLKQFGIKFADIMIGIVLGLGFQWWPELQEPWQYIAFIFVYINLIDYWIDYSPVLKRFPFKREIDVMLHLLIIFLMFLIVYATIQSILTLLTVYLLFRLADIVWIKRMQKTFQVSTHDKKYLDGWLKQNSLEALGCLIIVIIYLISLITNPLIILVLFIFWRVLSRVMASFYYKAIYFS